MTLPSRSAAFPNEHFAALCPAVVLEDGQRARRLGIKGQRFFMESIGHWAQRRQDAAAAIPTSGPTTSPPRPATARRSSPRPSARERVTVDFSDSSMALLNPNHAYGTVEDCIGYVARLIDSGADEILFLNQMGTIPQDAMMDTIRNIGEHVIPYFRTGPGKAQIDERNAKRKEGSLANVVSPRQRRNGRLPSSGATFSFEDALQR